MQNTNFIPNKIVGNDDVFEINDFTVVTEFEVFVLSLENAIQEMKAEVIAAEKDIDSPINSLRSLSDRIIEYENFPFKLDYIRQSTNGNMTMDKDENKDEVETNEADHQLSYLCQTALNFIKAEADFKENSVISKQYGITSDFILVYPIGKNNFLRESMVNMVQSAVNVASLNIDCEHPILLQIAAGACVGVVQNRNSITNFEGVVLNRCLHKHRYLDGVLEIFKQKVNAPIGHENDTRISLQLDFLKKLDAEEALDSATSYDHSNGPFEKCSHKYSFQLIDALLIKELCISAIWTDLPEHCLTENETFSNIDVQRNTHRWKLAVLFDAEFSYELSYSFTRLLEHKEEDYSSRSVKSLIPTSTNETGSLAANALDPLIYKPSMSFELVPKMFAEDDFSHESISACFPHITGTINSTDELKNEEIFLIQQSLLKKLSSCKSAPPNSLTTRLTSCLMSRIDKNLVGFSRLWNKFLEFLRHHWEFNLDLPGFTDDDKPDLSNCLLHQKLQMIQHCISIKRAKHSEMESMEGSRNSMSSNRENDDDEFYDAIEAFEQQDLPSTSYNAKEAPRGRSHPLNPPEYLKNNPNAQIYVPITQEQGPLTEDQLEKHESFLVSLEDTNLRSKAQSELLISDMQAFKAANPGCVLEDFLRWHSPRDLVDGELSERMKLEGNLWQEHWRATRPVPASKQNRLFNETKEVEQIFQFLSNIKLNSLIDLLLPIVSVQMAGILVENSIECLDSLERDFERLISRIQYASKSVDEIADNYYDVRDSLRSIEEHLVKYSTIVSLFKEQANKAKLPFETDSSFSAFATDLCKANWDSVDELSLKSPQANVPVPDSSDFQIVNILKSLLGDDEDVEESEWSKPERKQIILRTLVPSPGPGSRQMPQRMYTSYRQGEFLLCGAFTSDVTFM